MIAPNTPDLIPASPSAALASGGDGALREALEAALKDLRKLEGIREPKPCPDGIKGCLVSHFELKPGLIEQRILAALAAAPSAKPAGAGDEAMRQAEAEFTEYFVRNYPGPDTIIYNPKWHAPQLFRAARHALLAAQSLASPEPVAKILGYHHAWSGFDGDPCETVDDSDRPMGDDDVVTPLVSALATPMPSQEDRLREKVVAFFTARDAGPLKDCWDTETGEPEEGAARFASDWSWSDYHNAVRDARDELRAALSTAAKEGGL